MQVPFEKPEFSIPIGAAGALTLVVLTVAWGRGNYHVNQFRVYFEVANGVAPSKLIGDLADSFDKCFTSNRVAGARPLHTDPPVVVRFTCRLIPAKWVGRFDDVQLSATSDTSFVAGTLGKKWANFLNRHFLSGARSWSIVELVDGEDEEGPPGIVNLNNGKSYFLETAALERSTHRV